MATIMNVMVAVIERVESRAVHYYAAGYYYAAKRQQRHHGRRHDAQTRAAQAGAPLSILPPE